MSSIKAEIAFGAGFDRDNKVIKSTASWVCEAQDDIQRLACELFGGFTWIKSVGGWAAHDDKVILEEGRVIIVNTTESKRHEVIKFAEYVRDQLRQTAVALTISPVEFTII